MEIEDRDIPIPANRRAEQEAAEILIGLGFAEPEELEPEIAVLLREASRLAREEEERWLSHYYWDDELDNG